MVGEARREEKRGEEEDDWAGSRSSFVCALGAGKASRVKRGSKGGGGRRTCFLNGIIECPERRVAEPRELIVDGRDRFGQSLDSVQDRQDRLDSLLVESTRRSVQQIGVWDSSCERSRGTGRKAGGKGIQEGTNGREMAIGCGELVINDGFVEGGDEVKERSMRLGRLKGDEVRGENEVLCWHAERARRRWDGHVSSSLQRQAVSRLTRVDEATNGR
jgi:hypothetical protein